MKSLTKFFTFLLVLNLFAGLGLMGYLVATNRLDKEKGLAIVDMIKHTGTPVKFRDQVYDVLYPTTAPSTATASASQPSPGEIPASDATLANLATAQDRIEFARHAVEQERLRLENETRNLLARQKMLEEQRLAITKQVDALAVEKKAFDEQVKTTDTRLKDENFQKTVAIYNDLKPKQVKELLISLNQDLVADYFRAFEEERSTKIIAEFKSPDEKAFISAVLEKIRTSGTTPASMPSQSAATQAGAN